MQSAPDWSRLRAACGTCAHVPSALGGLMDPNPEVRDRARWLIDNHVVVQGDLYEGAPWTVEILVRQLMGEHPDRALAYDLLVEFARGNAPGSYVTDGDRRLPLADAVREEIANGAELYAADKAHSNHRVSRLAAMLIEDIADWVRD